MRFRINLATMLGIEVARFWMSHQQADVFKNFKRGSVNPFDLFLREKRSKGYKIFLMGYRYFASDPSWIVIAGG